jgi:hypothetical protein
MPTLTARAHFALTLAATAAAIGAAYLMPVPAMAASSISGSGHEITQNRSVGAFTTLRVEGPIDVHAHPGTPGALVVHAEDNIVPMIETVVDGQTLVVRLSSHATFHTSHDMNVDVSFQQLTGVAIHGSGNLRVDDLTSPQLQATISGSGDLRVAHAALGNVTTDIEGSGDMTLDGRADEARFSIAGSGDVHADGLAAKRVTVHISGSGDADVNATESLEAHVAGSGDVRYSGHPAQVNRQVAGSGDIEPK